jgi:hypothetical protein
MAWLVSPARHTGNVGAEAGHAMRYRLSLMAGLYSYQPVAVERALGMMVTASTTPPGTVRRSPALQRFNAEVRRFLEFG